MRHNARLVLSVALLLAPVPWPLQLVASASLFFASFSFAHDLCHGALGLTRHRNAACLSWVALLMLTSGHAMRRMHMRHHARPLADDDLEGLGACRSAFGALWAGPANVFALRCEAYRCAPRSERGTQLRESAVAGVLFALCLASGHNGLVIHAAVALTLQLTATLWASHIPHHPPPFAVAIATRLSFLRSPTLLSLAFHEKHHAHPKTPCHRLAELA